MLVLEGGLEAPGAGLTEGSPRAKENAFNIILSIFDKCGWHRPNKEAIRSDQEKLLQRIV